MAKSQVLWAIPRKVGAVTAAVVPTVAAVLAAEAPPAADRIPIRLEVLLAEDEREEEIGNQGPISTFLDVTAVNLGGSGES